MLIKADEYDDLMQRLSKETLKMNSMTVNTSPTNSRVKEPPVNKSWEEMYYEVSQKYTTSVVMGVRMRNFLRLYLETIEGIHVTDPSALSVEHRIEYLECAQFMQDNFGRVNNMIKEIKELI